MKIHREVERQKGRKKRMWGKKEVNKEREERTYRERDRGGREGQRKWWEEKKNVI